MAILPALCRNKLCKYTVSNLCATGSKKKTPPLGGVTGGVGQPDEEKLFGFVFTPIFFVIWLLAFK